MVRFGGFRILFKFHIGGYYLHSGIEFQFRNDGDTDIESVRNTAGKFSFRGIHGCNHGCIHRKFSGNVLSFNKNFSCIDGFQQHIQNLAFHQIYVIHVYHVAVGFAQQTSGCHRTAFFYGGFEVKTSEQLIVGNVRRNVYEFFLRSDIEE